MCFISAVSLYLLGCIAIAVCLVAIPGPASDPPGTPAKTPGANLTPRIFGKVVLLPLILWALIWFLFHNYFYLQWGLVRPGWNCWLPVALLGLACLSGVFSCLETALSCTTEKNLDEWLQRYLGGDAQEYQRCAKIKDMHLRLLADNEKIYNPVVVSLNNIANVALAVVCILAIDGTNIVFPTTVPGVPLLGGIPISDSWRDFANAWLLPGASGFVTVGVTLITLFASEAIPKKIAMRYAPGPLLYLSRLITLLNRSRLRQVCTWGIFIPLDKIFESLERLWRKVRH